MLTHKLFSGKTSLYIGAIIVLIICFSFRCYRFGQREALHIDEAMSVVLCHYNTMGWGESFADDSRMFTGNEMKAAFYSGDNSVAGTLHAISQLWKDTRDHPHSNLYYILLKTSFLGADTGDYSQLMFRAAGLNMLLFIISFFFIFCLARLLFNSNWVIWSILAIAFINPAAIYSTLSFREYQLQELMFSILAYISAIFFFCICRKETLKGKARLVVYALMMALAFHSGYFGIAYIAMLWGGLMLIALVKKETKSALFLGIALLLSLVFIVAIYPNFPAAFTSDRGGEAMEKVAIDSINKLYRTMVVPTFPQLNRYYFGVDKLLAIFGLIAIGAAFMYFKTKKISLNMKYCAALTLVCFIWIAFVVFFSPWKGAHYYRAIFPVLSIGLMGLLFIPKVKLYYPLLLILPIYLFWVSMLNIDRYKEYKDTTPIIFAGEADFNDQYYLHELFNEGRLIGFTFDKENFEKKMDELHNDAILAVVLDRDFSHYTEGAPTAPMDNFYTYVDTTKYEIVSRRFHRSFNTLFHLKKKENVSEVGE